MKLLLDAAFTAGRGSLTTACARHDSTWMPFAGLKGHVDVRGRVMTGVRWLCRISEPFQAMEVFVCLNSMFETPLGSEPCGEPQPSLRA